MTKRKGFTLIELLIVVVIIGVLSSMMSISSTSATDSAKASAILGNLKTIKTAALAVYIESGDYSDEDTLLTDVAAYMGTNETAIGNASFDIAIIDNSWYVYYKTTANDPTAKTREIIQNRAASAGILKGSAYSDTRISTALSGTYDGSANVVFGMKIR